MPAPEVTISLSLIGSAVLAALPKVLETLLGDRIARRKTAEAAEEAYKQALFTDATLVRQERAALQGELRARIGELEQEKAQLEAALEAARRGSVIRASGVET